MTDTSFRLIRLRRPPVLSVQEEPFVPRGVAMHEIDRIWRKLQRVNPAYFDGRIYHVIGVHRNGHGGATVHVQECAYRFYATQNEKRDLGVRLLGVKGIIERGGRYLLGLRSASVAVYPNQWEFAPGGGVDVGSTPPAAIIDELHEETGLDLAGEPTAIAMILDPIARTWEVIYRLACEPGEPHSRHDEYAEFQWTSKASPPADLTPIARAMIQLL